MARMFALIACRHPGYPVYLRRVILNMALVPNVGFERSSLMQNLAESSSSEVISTFVVQDVVSNQYSYSTAIGLFNTLINLVSRHGQNDFQRATDTKHLLTVGTGKDIQMSNCCPPSRRRIMRFVESEARRSSRPITWSTLIVAVVVGRRSSWWSHPLRFIVIASLQPPLLVPQAGDLTLDINFPGTPKILEDSSNSGTGTTPHLLCD